MHALRVPGLAAFLAILVLLTAACTTAPSSGVDVSEATGLPTGDTLHHADLRLSVTKPAAWCFLSAKERSAGGHGNRHYHPAVSLAGYPPRIVIAKYPQPHDGFNPSILIDRYPLDHLRFKTSDWLAGRIVQNYRAMFTGANPLIPVLYDTVGGKFTATFRLRYSIPVPDGPPFLMDEQVWAIANGMTAYLITARCTQEGADAHRPEIESVIASLKFD